MVQQMIRPEKTALEANSGSLTFLLIHERETRNEGVLELYGILLAVMC